ncbi:MAG: polyprenyl synthetase family protein, partial [Phycisphaeraceae bacterium]|nr:polyprenyl synthetase family protein [Phycisphaeraceae bacterium]
DDLRRGRPTLHKATNEAMAILAGDAMLTFAFQVIVERTAEPALAARLMHELAIGTTGMIAGQVYDTLGGFEPGLDRQQQLRTVHRNKTGALLRAACRLGAMSVLGAGASDAEPRLDALTRYGEAIGLMFQVVDDILDVTQSAEHTGKRTGKDAQAGKLTYPGVLGLDASRRIVSDLHAQADAALQPLGASAQPLRALAAYMAVRTK